MGDTKREKLLSKIAKLQALAMKAGTPEEAYAAGQKISQLIDEYEVSEFELNQAINAHEGNTTPQYEFTNAYTSDLYKVPMKWARILAVPVSSIFLCATAFSKERVYFYGSPENVEQSLSFFDTILQVLDRTTNETYRRASKRGEGRGWKTNFRSGFIQGFGHAILEQQEKRTALASTAIEVRSNALAKYMYQYVNPDAKKYGSQASIYNNRAYNLGYQEGHSHGR